MIQGLCCFATGAKDCNALLYTRGLRCVSSMIQVLIIMMEISTAPYLLKMLQPKARTKAIQTALTSHTHTHAHTHTHTHTHTRTHAHTHTHTHTHAHTHTHTLTHKHTHTHTQEQAHTNKHTNRCTIYQS